MGRSEEEEETQQAGAGGKDALIAMGKRPARDLGKETLQLSRKWWWFLFIMYTVLGLISCGRSQVLGLGGYSPLPPRPAKRCSQSALGLMGLWESNRETQEGLIPARPRWAI